MIFNKGFGFIWFLLYLAIISIFGCSQNIILTVSSDKPGAVLLNGELVEDHLSISRHSSVNFNDTDADQVLQTATDVARTTDGPDDVECDRATLGGGMGMGSRNSVRPATGAGDSYGRTTKQDDREHFSEATPRTSQNVS